MRKSLCGAVVCGLVLAWSGPAWSDDDSTAKDIVAKAIKAMGGEASLAKQKAATWTEIGTYYDMGAGMPFTGKYAIRLPDHFRMEIAGVFTSVMAGNMGWTQPDGGEARAMDQVDLAVQRNDRRAGFIASVLPLKNKAFTLTKLPESKVHDRPAVGVKVPRKDYPDVKLYFDAKTNLLAKSEWRTKAGEQQYKEVTMTMYYSKYKEIDGAKIPTLLVTIRDGKFWVEASVENYKAVGKLDDSVFTKP